MNERLLFVEDEMGVVLTVSDRLRSVGYDVDHAADAASGLDAARSESYDLVLLDIMLPDGDGFEVCRRMRQLGLAVPVLMLTARGETADKVNGLKTGADDYLTKPFEMEELLARIEALLRRSQHRVGEAAVQFGEVEVDLKQQVVRRQGRPLELSGLLFDLLAFFISHRGEVVSRDAVLDGVWGQDAMPSPRTVDVHVAWLRQRIEPEPAKPQYLLTVRGRGYRFVG